jgi:hypothetical protein
LYLAEFKQSKHRDSLKGKVQGIGTNKHRNLTKGNVREMRILSFPHP